MKLAGRPELDALCGEYLVGTLRGAARRRFQRSLAEEVLVAARLSYWEQRMAFEYPPQIALVPDDATWQRIRRSLDLDRHAPRWHQRLSLWRGWAIASTAASLALLLVVLLPRLSPPELPVFTPLAVMQGKGPDSQVSVAWSRDRSRLRLRARMPTLSAPDRSFELWLIADARSAPEPVAVLGALDGEFALPPGLAARILAGAKFAVSVEPAGGSPKAGPSGPIIALGEVRS